MPMKFDRYRLLVAAWSVVLFSLAPPHFAEAQNGIVRKQGFKFKEVLGGLQNPTDIEWLPDGRMLMISRQGQLYLYNVQYNGDSPNFNRIGTLLDLSSITCPNCSERGMLSVTVHPDFARNGWIYLYWVHTNLKTGGCECEISQVQNNVDAPTNRLSRFTLRDSKVDRNSEYIMFETSPVGRMHNGGDAAFGPDGYLYITTGDGHYPTNGDNPSTKENNLLGKVLRLTDTGMPAPGNPYMKDPDGHRCNTRRLRFDGAGNKKCQEIYHLGLRNPFGMAKDPNASHMRMLIGDVGDTTWEEISEVECCGSQYPPKHFGWPFREGPCLRGRKDSGACVPDGKYEDPIQFYDRPGPEGQTSAAIVAGCIVPNQVWPQEYDGAYFYADLRRGRIWHMKKGEQQCRGDTCGKQRSEYFAEEIVVDENPRRTFPLGTPLRLRMGPDAGMYMLSFDSGKIYRLWHTEDPNRSPTAVISDLIYSVNEDGLSVRFDGSKSSDPDRHDITLEWEFDDAGKKATGEIVSHTYDKPGTYNAKLIVKDELGRTSSQEVTIHVDNSGTSLETFEWEYSGCPPGYDACGVLEFCNDRGDHFAYRTPSCASNECFPGRSPVIRLDPGRKYHFTLRNGASGGPEPTNVHTHGLHITGAGDGDNVLREVSSGNCLDYTWDIPADHPSGTYWYHSHHHGSSEKQVGGGAFGMLIVNDAGNTPKWAANELHLQVAAIDGSRRILANGGLYEIFQIKAKQWYRLRLSIVEPLAVPRDVVFTTGCTVHKVASDGVWHSHVPGPAENKYYMTGASRADFAIMCPKDQSTMNIRWNGEVVAIMNVGSIEGSPDVMSEWDPPREYSLNDIKSADVETSFALTIERSTINYKEWDPTKSLVTINYDEIYQWRLPDTTSHPFHMHLYHMMVVSPGGCGDHKEGEFYDTISGPPCTVRFKTADFGQMMVFHCHVMDHSDNGAMGWANVMGGPENIVVSNQYTCSGLEKLSCPPTRAPTMPPTFPSAAYSLLQEDQTVYTGEEVPSSPPGFTFVLNADGSIAVFFGPIEVWKKDHDYTRYAPGKWRANLQGDCNMLVREEIEEVWVMRWKTQTISDKRCIFGVFYNDNGDLEIGVIEGNTDTVDEVLWSEPIHTITPTPTIGAMTIFPTTPPITSSPTASPSLSASPSLFPSTQGPTKTPSLLPTYALSSPPTTVPTVSPTAPYPTTTPAGYYVLMDRGTTLNKGDIALSTPSGYSIIFDDDCRLKVQKAKSPDILKTLGEPPSYGDCTAKFQEDCHLLIDTGLPGDDRFSFRSFTSKADNDGCFVAVYPDDTEMRIGVFFGSPEDTTLAVEWSEDIDEVIILPTLSPTPIPSLLPTRFTPTSTPSTGQPTISLSVSPSLFPSTQGPTKTPSLLPTYAPSSPPTTVPTVSPTAPYPTTTPAGYYVLMDRGTTLNKGDIALSTPSGYSIIFDDDCRLKVQKAKSPDILKTLGEPPSYGDCTAKFQEDCHLLIDTGLPGDDRFSFRSFTSKVDNDGCFVAVYPDDTEMRIGVFFGSPEDTTLAVEWSEDIDEVIILPTLSPTPIPSLLPTRFTPTSTPSTGQPTISLSVSPSLFPSTQGPTKTPSLLPTYAPSSPPTTVPTVSPTAPYPTTTPAGYYVLMDRGTTLNKGDIALSTPSGYSIIFDDDCRLKVQKAKSPDILKTLGEPPSYGDCTAKFQEDCHLLIDTGLPGDDRFSFRSFTSKADNDGCFVAVYPDDTEMRIGVFFGSPEDTTLAVEWSEDIDEVIILPTLSPTPIPSLLPTRFTPTSTPSTGQPTISLSVSPSLFPSTQGPTKTPSLLPTYAPSSPPTTVPTVSPTAPYPTTTPAGYYVLMDRGTTLNKGDIALSTPSGYSIIFDDDCRLKVQKAKSPDILKTLGEPPSYGDCTAKFQEDCHLLIDTGLPGDDRFSFRSFTSKVDNDGCFVAVYPDDTEMRIGVFFGSPEDTTLAVEWSEDIDEVIILPTLSPTPIPSLLPTRFTPTSTPSTGQPTISLSVSPSLFPSTQGPTKTPSLLPTYAPSSPPTTVPTVSPTTPYPVLPSPDPTMFPTEVAVTPSPAITPTAPMDIYVILDRTDQIDGGGEVLSSPIGYVSNMNTNGLFTVSKEGRTIWKTTLGGKGALPNYEFGVAGAWYIKLQGDCNLLMKNGGVTKWKTQTPIPGYEGDCFFGLFTDTDGDWKIGVVLGDVDNPGEVLWTDAPINI